jgi:hypothetical protein
MIKLICDKCAEEVAYLNSVPEFTNVRDVHGVLITIFDKCIHELCNSCYKLYERLDLPIAEFMEKSKEELDLLDSTFKVGDKVITSTGEVGVITDICTCDKCEKRGFYEPIVELETGPWDIYITDTDKQNGFSRFYSIGDHVYGNIDEESLKETTDSTKTYLQDFIQRYKELKKQAKVLSDLKKNKEK